MKPFKSLRRFKWSDVPKRRRQLTYVMTAVGFSTYTLESKFKDSHVGTRDMNSLFFYYSPYRTPSVISIMSWSTTWLRYASIFVLANCLAHAFFVLFCCQACIQHTYNELSLSCHVGSRHARSKFVHVCVSVVMMSWRARFIFEQLFWIL